MLTGKMTAKLSSPVVKVRMFSCRSKQCTSIAREDLTKGSSSSMGSFSSMGLLGMWGKVFLHRDVIKKRMLMVYGNRGLLRVRFARERSEDVDR